VSVTLQPFSSNDATEAKFRELVAALEPLGAARDAFYADAYTAYPLGSVLYALKRSPLTRILTEETFRKSFASIYEFFTRPGTFEFYLSLLRTIFGEGGNHHVYRACSRETRDRYRCAVGRARDVSRASHRR
jgi:hypothetical protein